MTPETRHKLSELLPTLGKRPQAVLERLLENGSVSTYELGKIGYDQPPRAAQDLKEQGVRLRMTNSKHPATGNRMGVYTLEDEQPLLDGKLTGRHSFPKKFRKHVLDHYQRMCPCCGVVLDESRLQIDHRIPYLVAGEADMSDLAQWMPLCSSHQRTKSWVCEHCPNYITKNPTICSSCYWAVPDGEYEHVATVHERRLALVWQGPEEIRLFNGMKALAAKTGVSPATLAKTTLEDIVRKNPP